MNINERVIYQAGANGDLINTPDPNGEDIDIPDNAFYVKGKILLRSNAKHSYRFGDKLWFAKIGEGSVSPYVPIFSQYVPNRNFGAPNTLRRSNTTPIGRMMSSLYWDIYSHRQGWDKTGPRAGQHYRRKITLRVCHGGAQQAVNRWLGNTKVLYVVAIWV